MKKLLCNMKIKFRGMLGNTFLSLSSKVLGMFLFLCTDIIIARFLTKEAYGEWSYYYAIISMLFWIVWFGINESTRVYVAREQEDLVSQNSVILCGFKLRISISVLFFVVFLVLIMLKIKNLSIFNKYPNIEELFLTGCFLCFTNSIVEFIKSINVGVVNFKNLFIITLIEFGGNLILGAGLLICTGNILGLGWGYVCASFVTGCIGIILLVNDRKKYGLLRKNIQYEYGIIKKIFRYSLPILIVSIGAMILTEMDVFMLGMYSDAIETGEYSIAKNLMSKVTHVNLAVCTSTMTAFAIINDENRKRKKKQFVKIMKFNFGICMCICVGVYLFSNIIIMLLYGEQYNNVHVVMKCLLPYYIGFSVSIFMAALLDYQGEAKKRIPYYTSMIVLNLILNYILIPRYGAMGAAIATDLSMIPYILGLLYLSCKIFGSMKEKGENYAENI